MRQSITVEELLLTGNALPSSSIYKNLIINQKHTVETETVTRCILKNNLQFHPMRGKPRHGILRTVRVKERSSQFFVTSWIVFCQNLQTDHLPNIELLSQYRLIKQLFSKTNVFFASRGKEDYQIVSTMPVCHIAPASSWNFHLRINCEKKNKTRENAKFEKQQHWIQHNRTLSTCNQKEYDDTFTDTLERGFPFSIMMTFRWGAIVLAWIAPYTPAAPPPTTNNFSSCKITKNKITHCKNRNRDRYSKL